MKDINLLSLGLTFILIGFLIIFIGLIFNVVASGKGTSNVKFSFFGLVGPIPFGFANDKRLFIFSMVVALILIILIWIFFYKRV